MLSGRAGTRTPFDPTFDLPLARATHDLARGLEINPDDGMSQLSLARVYQSSGMDEAALPLLERFAVQPKKNLSQQREKLRAAVEQGSIGASTAGCSTASSRSWAGPGSVGSG